MNFESHQQEVTRGHAEQVERTVYLVESPPLEDARSGIDLVAAGRVLWISRWRVLFVVVAFLALGIAYVVVTPKWYRAEVALMVRETASGLGIAGQLSQLGGLAGMVGLPSQARGREPLAVLRSNGFVSDFINENKLLPKLFADKWDDVLGNWQPGLESPPDVRDGVAYFEDSVRTITEDKRTGAVYLTIEWTDPALAARWANQMATAINEEMSRRALREAEASIAYLQAQLEVSEVVAVQQSVGRLLESEMQKVMLARATDDFAFRVIDSAVAPKKPVRPKMALVVLSFGMIGTMLALLSVWIEVLFRKDGEKC